MQIACLHKQQRDRDVCDKCWEPFSFFSWSFCYNSLIARAYIGAAAAYNVWSGIVPANLPMFSRAGPTHETYSHRLLRLISSVRAKQTKIYNIHDKE